MPKLTGEEEALAATLPTPPAVDIHAGNVWIIEWLSPDEPQTTGRLLHEWMEGRGRPGWSVCWPCTSKAEVMRAIERAAAYAERKQVSPILHLEAHGDLRGLEGPDGRDGLETLTWDELTQSLQRLNLATRCNLIVFVAACTGFAGLAALSRGPRAPASVLTGPESPINPRDLLNGAKEFYRRWWDASNFEELVAAVSREAGGVKFAWEPFHHLFYEVMISGAIIGMRPDSERPPDAASLQRIWDEMLMIDLYAENRDRFGMDWASIVGMIAARDSGPTALTP